jgi:hypothetical protein
MSRGSIYFRLFDVRLLKMFKICDDIHQTEQIRFWVGELTNFTPKQVDSVVEALKSKKTQPLETRAS